ncbi:2-dehydro-3-deoxygalactonokinase [Paracoccus sulfuroxidans]|uniref:2-keto-3-deoxygalactonate kinase n=1 Tax=Paracoccus sulfuroxidans TaxID=384678 RepID=A0A562NM38_9RHOB|nr:2-dehydro-3-deoxygalactonokinase [Paracoccus sulfuroxidans]TWI33277.1 2-keto-3-deoxygalactonate kinase [Paracoccus sulfuroxidans]
MVTPLWIAVDWGTTRLRVWAMGPDGPLEARSSDKGMGGLDRDQFEDALTELVGDWLPATGRLPVIACGMVGARTGWVEAEYRQTPCPPLDPQHATRPKVRDPRMDVMILPGLSQAAPPDVMRGEETQIAGFLAENPGFDGMLCLPGTHCKWVRLSGGKVIAFRTFMTGEVFSLLSRQSVLRLSMTDAQPDAASFAKAAAEALANPNLAQTGLFAIRAGSLLTQTSPEANAGRLSGLLIGAELAACRDFWQDRPTVIIGAPQLSGLYERALRDAGADARSADGGMLALSGLTAAFHELETT